MNNRQLGQNGYTVSEVGLGCWQFGGDFGEMTEETAMAIMETAVSHGVNFFDTADVYGAGQSESLIGAFIKSTGRKVTVATKFGRGGRTYPDGYSEDALRRSIDDSLNRLGTGCIDLLQLHCIPTEELKKGDVFSWLRKVKDEGLIKQFGASVETVEEGLICMEQDGLLSLQVIFNIFRQKLVTDLLPQAKDKGVGIIVRLPLASGLLSGKFTRETTFAPSDHRSYNRNGKFFNVGETFAGLPFEIGVELADDVKEKILPENLTMVNLAIRWILDHEAVSVVIPGASSPEQAGANARISDLAPLPGTLHKQLSAFYHNNVHAHIRGPY